MGRILFGKSRTVVLSSIHRSLMDFRGLEGILEDFGGTLEDFGGL